MTAGQLRKSILQYAIEGKLVSQKPNEEPASVLLEQIQVAKQELIKDGTIKKNKNESVIYRVDDHYYEIIGEKKIDITNEVPFDLPEGWVWVRLKNIVNLVTGAVFKKEQSTQNPLGNIRVLRGGNIRDNGYNLLDNDLYLNPSLVPENILLKKNNLITPAVTSLENVGKMARITKDYKDVTVGGFVYIIRPYILDDIFSKFLLVSLTNPNSLYHIKQITKKSGQAFYNINKALFNEKLVAIAPYEEQKRIVGKIEKLFEFLK